MYAHVHPHVHPLMCMACAWHVHGRWAGQLSIFRNTAESRALYRGISDVVMPEAFLREGGIEVRDPDGPRADPF